MKTRTKHNRNKCIYRQRGLTLLELLVAMFILAVGLLGIAGLQSYSLKSTQITGKQTYAILYTQELLDGIRSNASALSIDPSPYSVASGTPPSDPGLNCYSKSAGNTPACSSPADIARFQVYQTYQQLQQNISPTVGMNISVATVTNSSSKVVSIQLSWQEEVKTTDGNTKAQSTKIEARSYNLSALI